MDTLFQERGFLAISNDTASSREGEGTSGQIPLEEGRGPRGKDYSGLKGDWNRRRQRKKVGVSEETLSRGKRTRMFI